MNVHLTVLILYVAAKVSSWPMQRDVKYPVYKLQEYVRHIKTSNFYQVGNFYRKLTDMTLDVVFQFLKTAFFRHKNQEFYIKALCKSK